MALLTVRYESNGPSRFKALLGAEPLPPQLEQIPPPGPLVKPRPSHGLQSDMINQRVFNREITNRMNGSSHQKEKSASLLQSRLNFLPEYIRAPRHMLCGESHPNR